MKKEYRVIGLMSGTSLDGVDIVDVSFLETENKKWNFKINHAVIYDFDVALLKKLKKADELSAEQLMELSSKLGIVYAEYVHRFLKENNIKKENIDFVANHGQTIFHQPQKGFTLQIGNGPELAVYSQLPVVNDFRTKDVALGGNGAPLIPVADFLLFSQYADAFLNLGGFANISFKENEKVISFDICPVNFILNKLSEEMGNPYDKDGELGKKGELNKTLYQQLNGLSYYKMQAPKSLGQEWVKEQVFPLLEKEMEIKDQMRTIYEHQSFQVAAVLNKITASSILITGGGAKNKFFVELLESKTTKKIILPPNLLIDFKEAIGFAFLGLLRWKNKTNVWASVTGAKNDSCSGQIHYP